MSKHIAFQMLIDVSMRKFERSARMSRGLRRAGRNVKYWRSPPMALRWVGDAIQEAAKGFRRLKVQ
ncbi:hypothetical protein [Methylocystis hirsuta]|uniref:hypothetical protein n=1 Tax=Methylocystis hirsuta TaxID=369798 RepID=UPI0011CDC2FD|nr:hypothetical protein [Methylocystis hirsuta]